jgi:hypothetical protein
MSTLLSNEQQREIEQQGGRPIEVVHPDTQEVYMIVPGEVYDRLRALLDDEDFDLRDTYRAQEVALAKIWADPELDAYNNDDDRRE